jgi:hypothetical protein
MLLMQRDTITNNHKQCDTNSFGVYGLMYWVLRRCSTSVVAGALLVHCPGQKPPKRAVKRPARPYKSPIQNGLS